MKKVVIIVISIVCVIALGLGVFYFTKDKSKEGNSNTTEESKMTNEEKAKALKDKILERGYSTKDDAYKLAEYENKKIECEEPFIMVQWKVKYDSEGNPYTSEEDPDFMIYCHDELDNPKNIPNNVVDYGIATSEGTVSTKK